MNDRKNVNEFLDLAIQSGLDPKGPDFEKQLTEAVNEFASIINNLGPIDYEEGKSFILEANHGHFTLFQKHKLVRAISAKVATSAATINSNKGSNNGRGGRPPVPLQKMNTMYNYLTESDWETIQTGQLCEGIHCLASRCIKLNATTLTEQSFVHLASVLQVARDPRAMIQADLAQGFNIVRDIKKLGDALKGFLMLLLKLLIFLNFAVDYIWEDFGSCKILLRDMPMTCL